MVTRLPGFHHGNILVVDTINESSSGHLAAADPFHFGTYPLRHHESPPLHHVHDTLGGKKSSCTHLAFLELHSTILFLNNCSSGWFPVSTVTEFH